MDIIKQRTQELAGVDVDRAIELCGHHLFNLSEYIQRRSRKLSDAKPYRMTAQQVKFFEQEPDYLYERIKPALSRPDLINGTDYYLSELKQAEEDYSFALLFCGRNSHACSIELLKYFDNILMVLSDAYSALGFIPWKSPYSHATTAKNETSAED